MNVPVLVIILQIIFLVGVTTPTSVLRQTRQIVRGCAHHSWLCAAHTTQIDHRPPCASIMRVWSLAARCSVMNRPHFEVFALAKYSQTPQIRAFSHRAE